MGRPGMRWLLPREEHFFDLLERGADCAMDASTLLTQCCEASTFAEREAIVRNIGDAEYSSDRIIHEVYDALNKTFVTPLGRSDIFTLASSIENIVDAIHATCMQIVVHVMEDVPPGSVELARKV